MFRNVPARVPDSERASVIVYLRLPPPMARALAAATKRHSKRTGCHPSRGAVLRSLLAEHLAEYGGKL